jgi:hypothetical protein
MIILYIVLGIMGAAAIGGLTLITLLFQNKKTPRQLIFFHGLFAAAGLTMLIVYCIKNKTNPIESVILFSIAAAGGFVVAFKDLFGHKVPLWLGVVHGVLALSGFIYLIFFVLSLI